MVQTRRSLRSWYGAGPLHLLVMTASLSTAAYVVVELGVGELWNPGVWWQSIAIWFLGAVVLHDLLLFPIYALADRVFARISHRPGLRRRATVPVVNHVRVPALAIGLLFLLFFPGIVGQGASSYTNATGQTQDPFLERWLILSAGIACLSALFYAIRVRCARTRYSRRPEDVGGDEPLPAADPEPS